MVFDKYNKSESNAALLKNNIVTTSVDQKDIEYEYGRSMSIAVGGDIAGIIFTSDSDITNIKYEVNLGGTIIKSGTLFDGIDITEGKILPFYSCAHYLQHNILLISDQSKHGTIKIRMEIKTVRLDPWILTTIQTDFIIPYSTYEKYDYPGIRYDNFLRFGGGCGGLIYSN